ncbi:glycosyltransferase [Streptomyces albofaciens JCM 4342]|uniref:glycosyltransferase n=1 Tax=Streptomyces albofaciens TaxID=66866 RepID=UPI0012391419|nr:glycosyltransferase [Streptomyces albofaciens]KAA6214145.1 glycosyltransferase [Streptomyces albofaciens JCM 4342]
MRIALLTESGAPDASGETRPWCDRLVRGLTGHELEVYSLVRGPGGDPYRGRTVRTAPLYGELPAPLVWRPGERRARARGRLARRRFAVCFADLVAGFTSVRVPGVRAAEEAGGGAFTRASAFPRASAGAGDEPREDQADRFAAGLYGLAELARTQGRLPALLRSEQAVRLLETACRAPGAPRAAHGARVSDLLAVSEELERALRPLSLDWYGDAPGSAYAFGAGDVPAGGALATVDLCHAATGGPAALPGLLAKRFFGTPLLLTEYGVRLREHYLARAGAQLSAPVRALLGAFDIALAAETYARAALVVPGNAHIRRWQERCGADPERLRTVHPGMDADGFTAVPDAVADHCATLVWTGTVEPAKDLVCLLHAFARVHRAEPAATLRIVGAPGTGPDDAAYLAHCRALAAQLFPDEAADACSAGDNPVSFEEIGGPYAPRPQDAYAAGAVLVLSSVAEGFPRSLVEAMLSGRATVSTDVGAVCEVIGGTGLVVPPRNPRALADACLALLRDPGRRARLGAAARARAHELFTVEQNLAAFRGIYLELMARTPCRPAVGAAPGRDGAPRLFASPAEAHVPGRWAAMRGTGQPAPPTGRTPSWADPAPDGDSAPRAARRPAGDERLGSGGLEGERLEGERLEGERPPTTGPAHPRPAEPAAAHPRPAEPAAAGTVTGAGRQRGARP